MGDWKYDFTSAPRGKYRVVDTAKGSHEVFIPEWCIIAVQPNNQVLRSYWIPDQGRWNGVSKDKNTVVAWAEWPEFPQ